MNEKIAELERKNGQLEAQARSMTTTLRSAESSAKSLRDQTLRFKTLLAQVRTQAANDVRKRDMQITKMKERLNDRRRDTRPAASTIVIKTGDKPVRGTVREYDALGESVRSSTAAAAAAKALSEDTTDFLTQLSQTLADENDNILALVWQCLSTLKAVQGLPDDDHNPWTEEEAVGALNPVVAPPANLESLSMELDTVIGSLQEMLNQPNYVPVEELAEKNEELAEKNEEINLLTQRNAVLYEEWKKAIDLLDEWNQGLLNSVQTPEDSEGSRPTPDPTAPATAPRTKGKGKGKGKDRLRSLSTQSKLGNESETDAYLLQSQEAVTRSINRVRATDPQLASETEPQAVRRLETFEPRPLFQPQPEKPSVQEDAEPEHAQEPGPGQEQVPEREQEILEDRVIYEEEVTIIRMKSPAPPQDPRLPRKKQPAPLTPSREATRGVLPSEEPEHVPEPEPMITIEEFVCEPKPRLRRQQPVLDVAAVASPRRRSRRQRLPEPEVAPEPEPELPKPGPMATAEEPVPEPNLRSRRQQSALGPAPVASPRRGSRRQPQPEPEPETLPKPVPEPMAPVEKPAARSRRARQSVQEQPSIVVASPRRQARRQLQFAPEPEPETEPVLPEPVLPEPDDEPEVINEEPTPDPKPRGRKLRPSMPEATTTPRQQPRRQQQAAPEEEAETIAVASALRLRARRQPVARSPAVTESPAKLTLRRKKPAPLPEANIDTLKFQPRRGPKPLAAESKPEPEEKIVVVPEPESQSPELSDPPSRKRRRSERVVSPRHISKAHTATN